jgi:nucleoside-diphosphate-sugar epimerase
MKKVLLTGGSGFIGRHCIAPLRDRGFDVHAVSHARSGDDESVGLRWHNADLLDRRQMRQVIEEVEPTHLLHAAWYAVPGKFWASSENLKWVEASLNLLETFQATCGRRVVVAGTCAEYSWEGTEALSEATTKLAPASLYGACKHALHTILDAFARQSNIGYAWGRIFFPYGPHDHAEKLVSYAVRSLLRGEPVNCTHGQQLRDFIYVADAGSALAALLDSEVNGAVNVGSGKGVALKDVLESAASLTGRDDLLRLGALPTPNHEPASVVADVTRLRQEVGFAPAFTLKSGLEATVEWWRQRLSAA